MYQFPKELKNAYEASPLSFVFYQVLPHRAIPVLASGGFCRNVQMEHLERSEILQWLETGLYERIHPDDVGLIAKISEDFMCKRGPYDVAFRCRLGDEYVLIHGYGKWQTMPDGTELAVIGYVNLMNTKDSMLSIAEIYNLLQSDRFYNDPLTGLPNLNYFHEFGGGKAKTIRSAGKTPVIIYSDVFSMQSYNNQYGFQAGNALLILVAATLREFFPEALVLRGADDHFILITDLSSRDELSRRLELVHDRLRRTAQGNTSGIRSGICILSDEMAVPEALDHARHTMKRIDNDLTRLYAFFSQEEDDLYRQKRYIIENFDHALQAGWIHLYYQGITRLTTRKIAAFEALARWADPERGLISPGIFIPVLQEYHQLYKLDLYMLEQVCREIPARVDSGLPLVPVSVNFSRQDFDHTDVVAAMNTLYEKYGLESYVTKDFFIVEITEQDLAIGTDRFREQLERIRENGFQLWLDDFGSGYSALNVFSRYHFDLIKFDMDLLRHLDDSGGVNRLILQQLIVLSKKLGIHTLIEGMETEDQLEFVRKIGCEMVQGFYFNRPESLAEILARLGSGQSVKPCESREERQEMERLWFE
ncbi:MAG: EAL domain-containing protein [Oscillospiraceae bacterium]|nr:EAL domain-containing protein [Oscillospiraceae bacterium]